MAKDTKGHGSNKRVLGKTGRTTQEYEEHLRSSGSPETMARKKAAGSGVTSAKRGATYDDKGRMIDPGPHSRTSARGSFEPAYGAPDYHKTRREKAAKVRSTTQNKKY